MSRNRTPSQWADEILNKPTGLDDDYGNLLISLGAATATATKTQDPLCSSSSPQRNTIHHPPLSKSQANPSKAAKIPGKLKPACTTCHARKIRCDLPISPSPIPITTNASHNSSSRACTPCAKAGQARTCHRHRRRKRREEPDSAPDDGGGASTCGVQTGIVGAGGEGRGNGGRETGRGSEGAEPEIYLRELEEWLFRS